MYRNIDNQPNRILLWIGMGCVVTHMLVLLTMYFLSGYTWISYLLLDYEWFAGITSMLLIIEHTVWLHLLWMLADPPYYSMIFAYFGVLLAITGWIMELIVPTDPDPKSLHPYFCILFIVGCVVNISGSILLLPGRSRGVDSSYKYVFAFLGLSAAVISGIWFAWWMLKDQLKLRATWHIEQSFQITAYETYLSSLAVVFYWALALKQNAYVTWR